METLKRYKPSAADSIRFKECTEWLIHAFLGQSYWPGESLARNCQTICDENRIITYRNCLIFNQVGMDPNIHPRAWLKAYKHVVYSTTILSPIILEVYGPGDYHLKVIPLHYLNDSVDYSTEILSVLDYLDYKWWSSGKHSLKNSNSKLEPKQVIDIVTKTWTQL